MNRADFQQLAEERIRDAEVLIASGRWSAAYYLAGYAVECGLKACIAKLTNQHDFPDKRRVNASYTHRVSDLIAAAELDVVWEADVSADQALDANWQIVREWTEEARYQQRTQAKAEGLYHAVEDNLNGVMKWIKIHW